MYSNQFDNSSLFDSSLISLELKHQLPDNFLLRPLSLDDFDKGNENPKGFYIEIVLLFIGFVSTLGQLSIVEGLTKNKFEGKDKFFLFINFNLCIF